MSKNPAKPPVPAKNSPPEGQGAFTLEAEVERRIGEIVPQGVRAQVIAQMTTMVASEYFSGPIAHPRHLQAYEETCPGSADRIITMAEERNKHIMRMEDRLLTEETADQRRGMWLGAALFAGLIGAALSTALILKNPVMTGLFLGAAVLGAVGMFIKGRNGK